MSLDDPARARRLPRLTYVTSSATCARSVLDVARAAAEGGADAIQVREPHLADGALVDLVAAIVDAVAPHGARVLVNERLDVALAAGAHGVHLRDGGLRPAAVRAVLDASSGEALLVSVATHDAEGLAVATLEAVADCCTIGPLNDSPAKVALGLSGLRAVLEEARCRTGVLRPWIALGGVAPRDVPAIAALAAPGEAWGVAAIRAFQDARDDAATRSVAAAFLTALGRAAGAVRGR